MRDIVAAAGLAVAAATATMQLQSSDFSPGGAIPIRTMASDCGGVNRSPALSWSGAPKGVKSFALILHDADAPIAGGFYHWVVYNLPAGSQRLAAGATLSADQLGETSAGKPGYYGPCPPPGPAHHYTFTLYALDLARISSETPPTGPELERRIAGHVL
ncbi:MAG TPA: YbhB/YbcL family Raf kinase inhibitor-like protein, partial [Candidatus Cybelea sp.]